jgi:hypothetical protein
MSGGIKKAAVKSTVIFAVLILILLSVTASRVMAFDLVKTIQNITQSIVSYLPDFFPEPEESEFLLASEYKDFKAYFGDRKNGGRHRVKIVRGGTIVDFSFLEATLVPQKEATKSSSLSNLGDLSNLSASSSPTPTENLSTQHASVSADLTEQLKAIDAAQASIAAEIEKAKEDVKSIDKFIQKTVPDTQISFDEIAKDQMVVRTEVQENLDIYYWKRENDLREKIVIRKSPAPSKIIFSLSTEGLIPIDVGGGVIYFKDRSGTFQARLTKGYIKDLNGNFSNKVSTEVRNGQLIHTLDKNWLSDPERVFPLTLYFNFQMVNSQSTITPTPGTVEPITPIIDITGETYGISTPSALTTPKIYDGYVGEGVYYDESISRNTPIPKEKEAQ